MTDLIVNDIVSPDDDEEILARVREAPRRDGETIAAFLGRERWHFAMPTICVVNDDAVMRAEWPSREITATDRIRFLSRPGDMGGGGGGGNSTAKQIGAVVALVALAVIAPYAAGAVFGTAVAFGTTTYASIAASVLIAGGSLLISHFMKPKEGGKSEKKEELYSIGADGNTARPLQAIPVGYGRRIVSPDFAAPPYSVYEGDDQYLFELLCVGCGKYAFHEVRMDDTLLWTAAQGKNPAFGDIELQFVQPGDEVTLFNPNVVSASEVSGQQLPGMGNDNPWVGPFVINPPGTVCREIQIDLVWPSGASVTRKDITYGTPTHIEIEAREVDEVGLPVGGFFGLYNDSFWFAKDTQIRKTLKFGGLPGAGRYEVRVKRLNISVSQLSGFGLRGHDDVTWQGARAVIDGPNRFPGVTMIAMKARANEQLAGYATRKIQTVQTRILNYWNGSFFEEGPTRNPIDAAIDIWTNADYGPGLPIQNLDLSELYRYRAFYQAEGHTFDHFFTEATSVQEAVETALRVGRAHPSFIGDRLSMVRDEPRPTSLLLTDDELVRGTLRINRKLLDEEWADGVVVEYLDERNWKMADVDSAPDGVTLQAPVRVQVPGITNRKQAVGIARHLAAVSNYRRRTASFQIEMEGLMLKRGDRVAVQSDMPQTWGQGGKVRSYNASTRIMVVDRPVDFAVNESNWLEIRTPRGRPWGPVRVHERPAENEILIDGGDLNAVENAQGSITDALDRSDAQDSPSFAFSRGNPSTFKGIVHRGRFNGMLATIDLVIDRPEVYTTNEEGVPPPPAENSFLRSDVPTIDGLGGDVYQRHAQLVLRAGWVPHRAAMSYRADLSYDGGETYGEIYRGTSPALETTISGASFVRLRVAAIPISGVPGRASFVDIPVPDLELSNEYMRFALNMEDFRAVERRVFERKMIDVSLASGFDADDYLGQLIADSAVVLEETSETGKATITRLDYVESTASSQLAATRTVLEAAIVAGDTSTLATVAQTLIAYATELEATAIADSRVQARLGNALTGTTVEAWAINTLVAHATRDAATAIAFNSVSTRMQSGEIISAANAATTLAAFTTHGEAAAEADTRISARIGSGELVNSATLSSTLNAYATDIEAQAFANQAVTARVGSSAYGTVAQEFGVYANKFGELATQYTLDLDANGRVAGITAVNNLGQGPGAEAAIEFRFDRFTIGSPGLASASFAVVIDESGNARVGILGSLVARDSIGTNHLKARLITADKMVLDELITSSIQIGNDKITNLKILDGSVSSVASADSGGTECEVYMDLRAGATLALVATHRGANGSDYPSTTGLGHIFFDVNGAEFGFVGTNYFSYVLGNGVVLIRFMATTTQGRHSVGGAGTYRIRARSTNGAGIGGISLLAIELDK